MYKNLTYPSYLFILLVSITPFILAATDLEEAEILHSNTLPPIIASVTSAIRWGLFALILLYFIYHIKSSIKSIDTSFLWIVGFYMIQLIYAITTNSDIVRYVGLLAMSLTFPFFVTQVLTDNRQKVLAIFRVIIYVLAIFSILFNIEMIVSGSRFHGFSNNPNLYGITVLFWLTILLLPDEKKPLSNLINNIFIGILIFCILLSGSRNALVGVIIILLLQFRNNIRSFIGPALLFIIIGYILTTQLDLDFITDRLLNIENSIEDTGRIKVWEDAFIHINRNLLWGYGMDANVKVVHSGNIHNCYVRYLLTMGLICTIFAFINYLGYFIVLFKNLKDIPSCLIGFLIGYTINNLGEDYYVGIGSSVFVYVCITIGFITYYLTSRKSQPN